MVSATALAPVSAAEARSKYRSPRIAFQNTSSGSPLLLLVSLKKQRVRAFDLSGEISSSRISSGKPGFDTPTGVFSVLEKKVFHRSNIYAGAPMPHMQRLTWSGIALHAGVVPGYRASHGCIRLPASFAKSLFGITTVGSRVIVTSDEVEPIPFSHPNLIKPLPAENPPALARFGDTKVAANDRMQGISEIPRLFGVTPALAEAARDPEAFLPSRPRSRAEAKLIATTKLKKIQDSLRDARTAKEVATEKAAAAVAASKALAPKVEDANKVLAGLRKSIAEAEKNLAGTIAAFKAYHRGTAAGSQTKSEAELEKAILGARTDVDTARANFVRAQLEFATVLGSAATAEKTRTDAVADVQHSAALLRAAQRDLAENNKETDRNNKKISVFISMKDERIYVRQGHEPLLEAPIAVDDPRRRYGTHVFTAMRYDASGDNLDWRLVSAQLPQQGFVEEDDQRRGKKKRRARTKTMPYSEEASVQQASDALDSFTMSSEIQDTIAHLVRPGTSVIISDHELPANENGLGTEFVVLTR